jgi:hypothetical protein
MGMRNMTGRLVETPRDSFIEAEQREMIAFERKDKREAYLNERQASGAEGKLTLRRATAVIGTRRECASRNSGGTTLMSVSLGLWLAATGIVAVSFELRSSVIWDRSAVVESPVSV